MKPKKEVYYVLCGMVLLDIRSYKNSAGFNYILYYIEITASLIICTSWQPPYPVDHLDRGSPGTAVGEREQGSLYDESGAPLIRNRSWHVALI
jgi:hypothetical protein